MCWFPSNCCRWVLNESHKTKIMLYKWLYTWTPLCYAIRSWLTPKSSSTCLQVFSCIFSGICIYFEVWKAHWTCCVLWGGQRSVPLFNLQPTTAIILVFYLFFFAESTLQKLDGLRQEVRNADRKKREVSPFWKHFYQLTDIRSQQLDFQDFNWGFHFSYLFYISNCFSCCNQSKS